MSSNHGGGGLPGISLIDSVVHFLHDQQGVHLTIRPFIITFIVMIGVFFFIDPEQTIYNFEFLLFFSPIWIPLILLKPAFARRLEARRYEQYLDKDWVLLELRMPRDTTKSPLAMETFISNLHIGSGETNKYKIARGGTRPWFSFELVSIGGRVHFYIWVNVAYRKILEPYLYAQYPEVEIIEAEDYSRLVDPASHDWSMWGTEFKKSKPSPVPIKTYVDYELKPGAKPEENVDPLSQLVEYLGSIGPGEQFWIQIIFRMTKTETYAPKLNKAGKPYTWRDEAAELIEKMRQEGTMKGTHVDPATGISEEISLGNMTEGTKNGISAVERNVAKPGFDVGIRSIYAAPKDKYQGINIPGMLNMFKPFNSETNNSISVQGVWGAIFGDYPWEDKGGHHAAHLNHELINMYRQRMFFYSPYKGTWSIFSSEELATLFHVPTSGTTSPNLPRIQSATAAPPANLPT